MKKASRTYNIGHWEGYSATVEDVLNILLANSTYPIFFSPRIRCTTFKLIDYIQATRKEYYEEGYVEGRILLEAPISLEGKENEN